MSLPEFERYEAALESARERHQTELAALLSIPSVSADGGATDDSRRCAAWLCRHLRTIGLDRCEVVETSGHPIVRGEWLRQPDAPTLLLYGHYDVQPADPLEAWRSPPFEPRVAEEAIYARGASDSKGPVFGYLRALETLLAVDGGLPCNLIVVLEGDEENSPEPLRAYLESQRQHLSLCDACVISDGAMFSPTVPSLTLSLRGMVALQVRVDTLPEDVHSGLYGGLAPNAVHVLAELLATLHDTRGDVAIEGFDEGVLEPSPADALKWRELEQDGTAIRDEIGADRLVGDPARGVLERLWARPSLDVVGVWGGYVGGGVKTVVPASAWAKITCRLAPGQDASTVLAAVESHMIANCPSEGKLTIEWRLEGTDPVTTRRESLVVEAARRALAETFLQEVALTGNGGSMPVVSLVHEELGLDCVVLGFSRPTDRAHAPNERFALASLEACTRSVIRFLHIVGEVGVGGFGGTGAGRPSGNGNDPESESEVEQCRDDS